MRGAGNNRPAALDLHRVERDLEGGVLPAWEKGRVRGGEDRRRGVTAAAIDVNRRGEERETRGRDRGGA